MNTIPFNVNNYFRIRLNDFGRECLRKNHEELFKGTKWVGDFKLPDEDVDGWCKMQAWQVMQEFGPHIYLGGQMPFETSIQVQVTEQPNP